MFEQNDETQPETEVVSGGALQMLESAACDLQIATARRYPRPVALAKIRDSIIAQACTDEETARECYYILPRGGGSIEGPSVRLSEIVATCYKNLHVAGRILNHDQLTRVVTAQAVAWDLESNVRRSAEWSEPITIRSSDGVKITMLSAIAKAERNAIFKVVPRAIYNPVVRACMQVVAGDVATLATRRSRMIKAFGGWGIVTDQILALFGYESVDQITPDNFARLEGLYTAIKEGSTSIDEVFKPVQTAAPPPPAPPAPPPAPGAPPAPPPIPPRRPRGRPPREKHETPPPPEPPQGVLEEENTGAPEAAKENFNVRFERSDALPSATTQIRSELEKIGKSESRLMAVLHQWKFTNNAGIPLDEIDEATLSLINKRWEQVKAQL